jgi:hypothetical protein
MDDFSDGWKADRPVWVRAGSTAMKAQSGERMSDALRQAVLESGLTLYRVAKDSGVSYAVLHRFVVHMRPAAMETLDKLCAYLGLTLTRSLSDGQAHDGETRPGRNLIPHEHRPAGAARPAPAPSS